MTQTAQRPLSILGKATFKANGYVLYRIASGEKHYDITVVSGRVTSCVDQSGESCKGFHFTGSCRHAKLVQEREVQPQQHHADVQELQRALKACPPRLTAPTYAEVVARQRAERESERGNYELSVGYNSIEGLY